MAQLSPVARKCQKLARELLRLYKQLNALDDRITKAKEKRKSILGQIQYKVEKSDRLIRSKGALQ